MTAQLRSEFVKLRSTRTNAGLFAGMVVIVLLGVLLGGLLAKRYDLATYDTQVRLLLAGSAAALFAFLIGAMSITSEFRHGTIRTTFVFAPQRERVIGAKVVSSLLLGVGLGVLAEALAIGIGLAIIHGRGIPVALSTREIVELAAGTIGVAALWAALGVGVGSVIRNQVLTIVAVLAWVMVVESLVFQFVPRVGRFLPSNAGNAMSGDPSAHLLTPLAGGGMLLLWTAAFVAVGWLATVRRDVG